MFKHSVRCMLFSVVSIVSFTSVASAQQPRYTPPLGNPLPSQLNYFRQDVGVLDQYNGIVAPQSQLNREYQQLATQQKTNFQANQRAISQLRQSQTQASPTGVGAGYMIKSHYYSTMGGR